MRNHDASLRFLCLALAAWMGGQGVSLADNATPTAKNDFSTSAGNVPSSTQNASSVPKQKDVPAFDPNTAVIIKKSSEASAVLKASQTQGALKAGVNPGSIQKTSKLSPPSKLTKVGAVPGPIQKGVKSGGPIPKTGTGALANGQSEISQKNQLLLQKNMQNKSKANQALSNVMKKSDDAQKGIIGTMK